MSDDAASSAQPPGRLEPVVAVRGGTTFRIFGVIHGIVGGDDRAYMRFVADGLDGARHLLARCGRARGQGREDSGRSPDI